jgi:SRSO17 transposase
MELANYIETAMKSILKNPIYEVLSEIKITKILKQSNFVKREVGYPPFQIILHFLYMLVMQKRQSTFIKNSDKAYGKDVYYRFIKEKRYNWRKLLLLSATEILKKIKTLHKNGEYRLLIIDDTVEPKRGKFIEGTCKYIWSNKEHRSINALNIVSLNYADSHSTFQLDFSIKMNDSKRKSTSEFTAKLHHRSNAYQRKSEIIKGKNILALEMLERALDNGIDADYLLVDSWYAKPNFIKEANTLGMPVIARLPNNKLVWNFKGKYKTLNAIYDSLKNIRHKYSGKHGKISYKYFDSVLEHAVLGKVKLVFLHTGKDLLVFISTDISISGKEILETYKKRWNIEQGYKDLRLLFGLGKEENRIYEALIGKITLSMFTYNIVSYINRIKHEPQTLGELFRDLECELEALTISMQLFIQILTKISEIQNVVKDNKDLLQIIAVISAYTQKQLGFMCES